MMAFAYESNPRLASNMTTSLMDNATGGNATDLSGIPQVRLHTVLVCVVGMLAFGVLGSLSSLALLLSTRCKSSVRSMDFGLPLGLAAADLLLCIVWVPIEIFRLCLNHAHIGYPSFLCYLDAILFYFCLSAIVFIIFFIALHRVFVCLSIQTVARKYAIIGLVTSSILAALFTSIVLYEYGRTVDYGICTQKALPNGITHIYLPILLVNGIYALVIAVICVCMVGIVVKQRQKLNPLPPIPVAKSTPIKAPSKKVTEKLKTKELSDRELSDKSQENESSHCSVRFMEPSCSKERSNNSSKTASKESFFSRPFLGFTRDCKKAEKSADDSDIDDDEFDQKMMKKLQKTASGRRHTVANIGLGESLYGTKKEGFGSRSPSPNPTNYQYVRKWSVDIVALQDQLENPKKIYETSSFSEFKRFREKRDLDENKIEEEKHDDKDSEGNKRKESEGKANALKIASCLPNCEDLKTNTKPAESNQKKDNRESSSAKKAVTLDESIANTSPPPNGKEQPADSGAEGKQKSSGSSETKPANDTKVVHNSNTAVVSALKNSSSRDKDKFECRISENVDVIDDGIESEEQGDCDGDDDEEEDGEGEGILEVVPMENKKELMQELQLHTTCLLLALVVLVCTLPFCLLQLMQDFMQPTLNRNALWVTSAVLLVQVPIHTLIVAWLERKLWIALRHMRVALANLTCVCYCNIGKGRQCFGRPHYNGKSATV